jgi:uncharacterized cupin superfamily protein
MVPEAPLEDTEHGRVPSGDGWFVLNARDAKWQVNELGAYCPFEGEPRFKQLGFNISVLQPGQPMSMYHWEEDQEGFLVIAGEPLLIVEGEERPLRQWDFFHCPPHTDHVIVGAGDGPAVVVAVGSRNTIGDDWGGYTVDEAAIRHGAGVESATTKGAEAYARFTRPAPQKYQDGWLP